MTRKQRKESLREMGEEMLAREGWPPKDKLLTTAMLEQMTGRKAPKNR